MRRALTASVSVAAMLLAQVPAGVALAKTAGEPQPEKSWSRWIPQHYSAQPASGGTPAQRRWWVEFQSPELDELQAIAAANNADLKAAVARIAQAEASARVSNAGQSPTIDAIVRAERRAPEFGIGTAPTRSDYRSRKIYQAGLRVGYEVDLWGKGAYQQNAALAQIQATVFAREAFALSLSADVATTYFEVLSLREQVALARTDVETARKIGATIARRVERGDLSLFEQDQQDITIADAESRLFELQRRQDKAEGDLAFLIGRPRGMLELRGDNLHDIAIPMIDAGLPGAMICRRPDIRQSEAELTAARANVGLARKSLMPTFSLTAEGGYGTSNLSKALSPQSIFTDVLGQLVQSIFDGGRRKGQIAQNKAVAEEMLERYRSSILRALRDVDEALTGTRLTGERLNSLDGAANKAERLVSLSNRVFERGALDYGALLDSQRLHYRTRSQAVEARYDRLRASVDLYKALGGGLAYRGDTCVADTAAPVEPSQQAPVQAADQAGTQSASPVPAAAPTPPPAKPKSRRW